MTPPGGLKARPAGPPTMSGVPVGARDHRAAVAGSRWPGWLSTSSWRCTSRRSRGVDAGAARRLAPEHPPGLRAAARTEAVPRTAKLRDERRGVRRPATLPLALGRACSWSMAWPQRPECGDALAASGPWASADPDRGFAPSAPRPPIQFVTDATGDDSAAAGGKLTGRTKVRSRHRHRATPCRSASRTGSPELPSLSHVAPSGVAELVLRRLGSRQSPRPFPRHALLRGGAGALGLASHHRAGIAPPAGLSPPHSCLRRASNEMPEIYGGSLILG